MPNRLGTIHPKLLTKLDGNFYESTCTIQQATETQNGYGELVESWANVADHVDIPCRKAPLAAGTSEQREAAQLYAETYYTVTLAGNYPSITAKMRAVIADANYDIETTQLDGSGKTTHLTVRLVS